MDINNNTGHLPVILVINRFPTQQLAEIGKQLQSLPVLPSMKLVKQVPFFPAQFYGVSDASHLEREMLQEATHTLLETLDRVGIHATYQVVRGHPSQLSARGGLVIQTMTEFTRWFAALEVSIEAHAAVMVANC